MAPLAQLQRSQRSGGGSGGAAALPPNSVEALASSLCSNTYLIVPELF